MRRVVEIFAVGAALAVGVSTARADLQVCHKVGTNNAIVFDMESLEPGCTQTQTTDRGWFRVEPNQCVKVWTGDVRNHDFWWTAHQVNNLAVWGLDLFQWDVPSANHFGFGICAERVPDYCSINTCSYERHMWLDRSLLTRRDMFLVLHGFNGFEVQTVRP
jgi:hypothetical protein